LCTNKEFIPVEMIISLRLLFAANYWKTSGKIGIASGNYEWVNDEVFIHLLLISVNLQDVFGNVVEFSGDQYGSRFIQQKLETATNEEKQTVFDEIIPSNALQLIQDLFGNYVRP